jgi:hypothetical protein
MQIQEQIQISPGVILHYEGDNVYSIIKQKLASSLGDLEESVITLTREELFDISLKVFPNLG